MVREFTRLSLAGLIALGCLGPAGAVGSLKEGRPRVGVERTKEFLLVQRRSCKAVITCEEAVEMWCGGYRRADGDGDGIPCENVCSSRSQVDGIRSKTGC
jgi:hypothetical protein